MAEIGVAQQVIFCAPTIREGRDFGQLQIAECDHELEQQLASLPAVSKEERSNKAASQAPPKKRKRRKDGNIPQFDLHHELERISGVDLTRIDGIDVMTGQI